MTPGAPTMVEFVAFVPQGADMTSPNSEKPVTVVVAENEPTKTDEIVKLDESRRRQLREAKKEAFWAGRNLASRQSARRAA